MGLPMTIIGLKTEDNGIQGLCLTHTQQQQHHHRYPTSTPQRHRCSASSPPLSLSFLQMLAMLFFLFCFLSFVTACWCIWSSSVSSYQTFFVTFLDFYHTHSLVESSPLHLVHIKLNPCGDKSSVPAKRRSDIADTVSRTETESCEMIMTFD